MHLYTLIIGTVLFPQVHSLNCFVCPKSTPTCPQMQCSAEMNQCGALRLISYLENSKLADISSKSCLPSQQCINGSINLGVARTVFTNACCNSNLCNKNNAAEPPKAKPNGKKCYRCDGQGDCSGTLDCDGDEDFCIKASVTLQGKTEFAKGCATRSVCSTDSNASIPGLSTISCCEGNFCNGAAGARAGLLLLVPMLISNLIFSN